MRNFFTLNCSGSDLPYRMSDRILDIAGIVLVILQLLLFIGLYEWDKEQQCDGVESPSYAVWMVLAVLFWLIGFGASRNRVDGACRLVLVDWLWGFTESVFR